MIKVKVVLEETDVCMNSCSESVHDYCSLSLIFVSFVLAASFIAKF